MPDKADKKDAPASLRTELDAAHAARAIRLWGDPGEPLSRFETAESRHAALLDLRARIVAAEVARAKAAAGARDVLSHAAMGRDSDHLYLNKSRGAADEATSMADVVREAGKRAFGGGLAGAGSMV